MVRLFERLYMFIDTITNFLGTVFDSAETAVHTVSDSFGCFVDVVGIFPASVTAACMVCICIGLLYLILGR